MLSALYWCVTLFIVVSHVFFFFKQKTAYEMRISDWSSDVCSSDLPLAHRLGVGAARQAEAIFALVEAAGLDQPRRGQVGKPDDRDRPERESQIGRASCRERVGQYG